MIGANIDQMYHQCQSYHNQFFLAFIMQPQKLTLLRLQKQQASLDRQPIPNSLVCRQGQLKFHFCLHGLEGPYEGGFYHGMLQLHQNYPFNAPKLFFYTPNGRFDLNMPICTSFTNYHQESWSSAWNVRSLILATISFMYSEEPSYGCRRDSEKKRKDYAKNSLSFNLKDNKNFKEFFGDSLRKMGVLDEKYQPVLKEKEGEEEKKAQSEPESVQINADSDDSDDYDQGEISDEDERQIIQLNGDEPQARIMQYPEEEKPIDLEQRLLQEDDQRKHQQEMRRRQRRDLRSAVGKAIIYVTIFGGVCYLAYRFMH